MRAAISSVCDYLTEWRPVVKQPFELPVPAAFFSSHPVQPKDVIQVFLQFLPVGGLLALRECNSVTAVIYNHLMTLVRLPVGRGSRQALVPT
jgi:hypothetical protein